MELNPDTVYETEFLLLTLEKEFTASAISKHLNISLSTVRRKIKRLKEQAIIERIRSNETGYWKIVSQ
jgi:predicted transcriptional regulator